MSLSVIIPASDGLGWTANIFGIPANTSHISLNASNSNIATISAVSATGGTLATTTGIFGQAFLVPGAGWGGATPTPPIVGNPTANGYTASQNAVARWDVVPNQTFTATFNVGLLAFHSSGISHVTIAVNGGPWLTVSTPSANPQTANVYDIGVASDGIIEYWATLNAADFADASGIEIRAIAYPNIGTPKVLESLYLNANHGGTLDGPIKYVSPTGNDSTGDGTLGNPYLTIGRASNYGYPDVSPWDNGEIRLQEGTYDQGSSDFPYPSTTWGYLTVTAAPGADPANVKITTCDQFNTWGLRTKLQHYKNITVAPIDGSNQYIFSSVGGLNSTLWIDGVNCIGPGRTVNSSWTNNAFVSIYINDTSFSACRDGQGGATLERNTSVNGIGSDAFQGAVCVINCTCDGTDGTGTDFHADFYQIFAGPGITVQQLILYDVVCTCSAGAEGSQGVFVGRGFDGIKDAAFINVSMDNTLDGGGSGAPAIFSIETPTINLYIYNSRFVGHSFLRTDFDFVATDVVFESTVFTSLNPTPPIAGVTIR